MFFAEVDKLEMIWAAWIWRSALRDAVRWTIFVKFIRLRRPAYTYHIMRVSVCMCVHVYVCMCGVCVCVFEGARSVYD